MSGRVVVHMVKANLQVETCEIGSKAAFLREKKEKVGAHLWQNLRFIVH